MLPLSLLLHPIFRPQDLKLMNTSPYKGSVRSLSSTNQITHLKDVHTGSLFSPY